MQWMEMIRLLSSASGCREAILEAAAGLAEIRTACRDVETFLFQHHQYEGDLAALLLWNNDRKPVRTREGILLAHNLERYGQVDHAVWQPAAGAPHSAEAAGRDRGGRGGGDEE